MNMGTRFARAVKFVTKFTRSTSYFPLRHTDSWSRHRLGTQSTLMAAAQDGSIFFPRAPPPSYTELVNKGNYSYNQMQNMPEPREKSCTPPLEEVIIEGRLRYKTDKINGKKYLNRAWHKIWGMLQGQTLYRCKPRPEPSEWLSKRGFTAEQQQQQQRKQHASLLPQAADPIPVSGCSVDIARDYTKAPGVFRLKARIGADLVELLLQAEDHNDMLRWIPAIQKMSSYM